MELTKTVGSGDKKFITVLADGKFHQSVPDGAEGAVIRTYKDKDDVEHSKTELVFDEAKGMITKFYFEDGDFGKNFLIELDSDGVIALSTAGSFGEDLMKKFPSIDRTKEVRLVPFAFEDDKGKNRKGVTVYQDDVKVDNYYWDKDAKKSSNGIPETEGDVSKFSSDDWKMHFMVVRKFLVKEIEALAINF